MEISHLARSSCSNEQLLLLLAIHFNIPVDLPQEQISPLFGTFIQREIDQEGNIKLIVRDLFSTTSEEFISKFRECFSVRNTGFRGKTGTKDSVKYRLSIWRANNPTYTEDEIYLAAQYHCAHYREISGGLLMAADNFILKHDVNGMVSKLSAVIDEAKEMEEVDDEFN